MKKKLIAAGLAGLMSVSMVSTAFATGGDPKPVSSGGVENYDNGTDIYAGVILEDPDAKIRVNVPTLFAFVVNGSVESKFDDKAITVENEALLLPNVKVNVEDGTVADGEKRNYQVEVVSDGAMYFENFSTKRADADSTSTSGRDGIEVKITGSIENQGEAVSRNYWEHIGGEPSGEKGKDFKKYRLSVSEKDAAAPNFFEVELGNGIFGMKDAIALDAPDVSSEDNVDKETNYAINGSKKFVDFGVQVGGTRTDYTQVEESAKVGTIVWTVGYEVENSGSTTTAPDADYLDKPGTTTTQP